MMDARNHKFEEIATWLLTKFSKKDLVDKLFVVGSILKNEFDLVNDIDVVQLITFQDREALKNYSTFIIKIQIEFLNIFKKPIHITTFTQNELEEFNEFMEKNSYLKIF